MVNSITSLSGLSGAMLARAADADPASLRPSGAAPGAADPAQMAAVAAATAAYWSIAVPPMPAASGLSATIADGGNVEAARGRAAAVAAELRRIQGHVDAALGARATAADSQDGIDAALERIRGLSGGIAVAPEGTGDAAAAFAGASVAELGAIFPAAFREYAAPARSGAAGVAGGKGDSGVSDLQFFQIFRISQVVASGIAASGTIHALAERIATRAGDQGPSLIDLQAERAEAQRTAAAQGKSADLTIFTWPIGDIDLAASLVTTSGHDRLAAYGRFVEMTAQALTQAAKT